MKRLVALALLLPGPVWADAATDAERASERVLVEANVLHVYFTANDAGRVTLLFGRQVADWQAEAVLRALEREAAIHGITHARVDTDYCPIR